MMSEQQRRFATIFVPESGIYRQENTAIIAIVAHAPKTPEDYKQRIAGVYSFAHITVEVHCCPADKLYDEETACNGMVEV